MFCRISKKEYSHIHNFLLFPENILNALNKKYFYKTILAKNTVDSETRFLKTGTFIIYLWEWFCVLNLKQCILKILQFVFRAALLIAKCFKSSWILQVICCILSEMLRLKCAQASLYQLDRTLLSMKRFVRNNLSERSSELFKASIVIEVQNSSFGR